MLLVPGLLAVPSTAEAAQWGSSYGDPWGFCPDQSFLPSTYTSVVTNDPFVGSNPEQNTFWGIHSDPGWDDWYGYWYGDFAGGPGGDSGWHYIGTSYYGNPPLHWNFADFGWQVHGHAKQYVTYWNWTFDGDCGLWGGDWWSPPPYMADVYGYPVVDIYVDSVPPNPAQPRVVSVTTSSVTFAWDPVTDRGDGAGADYFVIGMGWYDSWLTVDGGPAQQRATTVAPRQLTASGLHSGQTACVHVIAADQLGNATADQQRCAQVIAPPPMPAPPPAGAIGVNPKPNGLTGLDSWFWLQPAPSGQTVSVAAGGYQYQVTQTPTAVSWDFGDGSTLRLPMPAGAGAAYPAQSPVTHTYDRYSASGYSVTATVTWSDQWTVNALGATLGPYQLGTQQSSATPLPYAVEQAQAVLGG